VVKIGGSLLALDDLKTRLRAWLTKQPRRANAILVGGGALVDVLRTMDRKHGLDADVVHWLSIRAMAINGELVSTLLGLHGSLMSLKEVLHAPQDCQCTVVDPWDFVRNDNAQMHDPLPTGWHVTSDSIAARLANTLGNAQLVLLKSSLPQPPFSVANASVQGYVDEFFPTAAAGLRPILCVNLRDDAFTEVALRS
jgi:aspartokinase-like uncharacterized kinase